MSGTCLNRSACFGAARAAIAAALMIATATPGSFAGTPPRIVTTQRAVVALDAFKPDDPLMTKAPQTAKALSATIVTAKFDNTPALKAFAEIAKQSGYVIEPYNSGGNNPTKYLNVTTNVVNQPFWAAMREICMRGNVALYYYGDDDPDKIQLMPSNYGQQNMMKAAASVQGPYMTVVTNIDRVNTVNMASPEKTDRKVNLQLYNFAEPKARPVQYKYNPTIDEAMDDNGNTMVPSSSDVNQGGMSSARGISWYTYVALPYPTTNPGKRIARIRGHIDAKVQLQSEPWEIVDPLKAKQETKTIGGKKYIFKSFKKGNDDNQYTLELEMFRGNDEDQNTFQQNAFSSQPNIKLIDNANGRYQAWGGGGSNDGDKVTRQFTLALRNRTAGGRASSDADKAPNKLIIELPSATQDVPIPFELVDLPMP